MDNPVKEILKKLMLADGKITEGELSRRTKVAQPTIHRILSGEIKESKPSTLKPLANYFGLTLAQMQGDEPLPVQREIEVVQSLQNQGINSGGYLGSPARLLPRITWEQATTWKEDCKAYQHDSSRGWVATNKNIGPYAYGLVIQGNSMVSSHGPSFEDGFEIIVDPDRRPVHHDFVVVKQADKPSAVLRQLSVEGGAYDLSPLNPRYPVSSLQDIDQICGVVCQLLGNF